MKNKIVFFHLLNDCSGSPKVLSQVIKICQKKGYQTELFTNNYKTGFLNGIADIEHKIFYKRSENKYLTLFFYFFSQVLLFFQCLKYWNKDVIFYINTIMPFGAALSAKILGKKVIYHLHETSFNSKLLKKFLKKIVNLTADKIIFVSDYLLKTENFPNKKQVVIYNSIEEIKYVQKNKTCDYFKVLMICSLKKYKGIFEFIKLAEMLSNIPKIKFILVLNATIREIKNYLKDIEIPHNIEIYDKKRDVYDFYSNADILLNLSRPYECIETFGLTILEAMIFGLPVIVPTVGGPAELVRNGIEGFLISCYELEKIAEKIKLLMNDNEQYCYLSENAKKRAKYFNFENFEKKICEEIRNI